MKLGVIILTIGVLTYWPGRSEWQHYNRMMALCMIDHHTIPECERRMDSKLYQYLERVYGR